MPSRGTMRCNRGCDVAERQSADEKTGLFGNHGADQLIGKIDDMDLSNIAGRSGHRACDFLRFEFSRSKVGVKMFSSM